MWFLQNDESVRPESRERYRRIGLPLDEFPDNDNIPYEMYVREARRIVGRHVFTEHDNRPAPGLVRTPIHADSIAFTDWAMDSHDCTWDRSPGYAYDGKLILTEESRPAQIPWRSLLPQGVDNLIVPVCLSATHVAWGAVRLEPVWMMTGEAAGLAAALARRQGTTPGKLDADLLVRALCEKRHFVSFFNDLEAAAGPSRHARRPVFCGARILPGLQRPSRRAADRVRASRLGRRIDHAPRRPPRCDGVCQTGASGGSRRFPQTGTYARRSHAEHVARRQRRASSSRLRQRAAHLHPPRRKTSPIHRTSCHRAAQWRSSHERALGSPARRHRRGNRRQPSRARPLPQHGSRAHVDQRRPPAGEMETSRFRFGWWRQFPAPRRRPTRAVVASTHSGFQGRRPARDLLLQRRRPNLDRSRSCSPDPKTRACGMS